MVNFKFFDVITDEPGLPNTLLIQIDLRSLLSQVSPSTLLTCIDLLSLNA